MDGMPWITGRSLQVWHYTAASWGIAQVHLVLYRLQLGHCIGHMYVRHCTEVITARSFIVGVALYSCWQGYCTSHLYVQYCIDYSRGIAQGTVQMLLQQGCCSGHICIYGTVKILLQGNCIRHTCIYGYVQMFLPYSKVIVQCRASVYLVLYSIGHMAVYRGNPLLWVCAHNIHQITEKSCLAPLVSYLFIYRGRKGKHAVSMVRIT